MLPKLESLSARLKQLCEDAEVVKCIRCGMTPPLEADSDFIESAGWDALTSEFYDGKMTRSLEGVLCPQCRNDFLVFLGFAAGEVRPPEEHTTVEPPPAGGEEGAPPAPKEAPPEVPPGEALDRSLASVQESLKELKNKRRG